MDWIKQWLAFSGPEPAVPPLPRPGWSHVAAAGVATAVYAAVYGTIVWPMFTVHELAYHWHVEWAETFYRTGHVVMPHFLYEALTAGLYATRLVPSFLLAGRLVVIASYAVIAVLLYAVLFVAFHRDTRIGRAPVLLVVTLMALVAQPIVRAKWAEIGWIWTEPYNIQSLTLLKPFAVAGFFFTARSLFGRYRWDWRIVAMFFLVTAVGPLAKPSFLICLLPAVGILTVARIVRRSPASYGALLAGFWVPAAAVVSWQYLRTFAGGHNAGAYQDTIIWAPLKVMSHFATGLAGKFFVSVAFPLVVVLLHWKRAWRDGMLQLAWLTFFFGAFYAYMLAEKIHWGDGNFIWSAYATMFVLFIASVVFWLRQVTAVPPRSWLWLRELICFGVLAAHVAAGVLLDKAYLTNTWIMKGF